MNKKMLSMAILTMILSGCVVRQTPNMVVAAPPYPAPTVYTEAPAVEQVQIVYPVVESAYIWDPLAGGYFFVYGGNRHYMAKGWNYRIHGVPHGAFRGGAVLRRH